MSRKALKFLWGLSVAALLLLPSCAVPGKARGDDSNDPLTWVTWGGYEGFMELLGQECPDIELELIPYGGANRTGYSWVRMRADDIEDIFTTTQILDEELAKERLADLSNYDFINNFSTSVLDQVAIDGGVYLLPVNYSMYGIFYNKTLMEEHGWELPENFDQLEALCEEIRAEGLLPGVIGTQLTGNAFSTVFNLAKTSWLTTPEGLNWERDFLEGDATAKGVWEGTMDYVQRYIDIGMFHTDPEDRGNPEVLLDYLGNRKAVFCTAVFTVNITELPNTGDKLGMMPFISQDGSKNVYMYSPSSYIGISKRLTEPGNEKKLEKAIRLLSLLYSPQGQDSFTTEQTPCMLSVLDSTPVAKDSMIYDAQQAMWEGRAFPMTYACWENVLSDMGQAYKDWFRGEKGMDSQACIARMDELLQNHLQQSEQIYFCESTADFTLEETGRLLGKALGSAAGVDAVMVPVGNHVAENRELMACVSGRLYAGKIDTDTALSICPGCDGEYAVMSMTGSQARNLAGKGFDTKGGQPFPYLLVTKGEKELEDDTVYQVAFLMQGYTEETGKAYHARIIKGSLRAFVRTWLEEQKAVSPDGNPWN